MYTNSSGVMTVSSGSLALGSTASVGYWGKGSLHVNGGAVTLAGALLVGSGSAATGTMTVSGGSLVASTATLGHYGTGSMYLTGGNAAFTGAVNVGVRTGKGYLGISNATDNVSIGQTLSVGANGTLEVFADLSLADASSPIFNAGALSLDVLGGYAVTLDNLGAVSVDTQVWIAEVASDVDQSVKDIVWQLNGLMEGYEANFEWIGNNLFLTVTPVPEPALSAALLALLSLALAVRRRK